ncbi:hypothetical protein RV18_GL000695 [Enterococcus termitis]|nr:hypothetical protein RV18_GL000695 [Enterococcus termitis]
MEIDEEFIQSLEGEIYSNTESLPNNGELIVELPEDIKNLDKNVIEPYTIFGPDDRSYVSNTSIFPYSAVCQLVMEYSNGTYVGTGNIINNNYVLTAGHNLYSTERREWAKSVTVIPGAYPVGPYSVGTYFGKTTAKKMTVPSGWINNGQTKDDIGVVELRDAIGKKTGSFGLTTKITNPITLTGFHGDWYTATGQPRMATETKNYESLTNDSIRYKLDNWGGSSGSGIYSNKNYQIFGVNAYGLKADYQPNNSTGYNFATRINQSWFNFVATEAKFTPPSRKENKLVSIKSSGYTIWKSIINWNKQTDTSDKLGRVYKVKYAYSHFNGETYYSLYDQNDNWQGYINASGTKEVASQALNKSVTLTKEGVTFWGNFFFSGKKGDTTGKLGKVYNAKLTYTLGNGVKYYSLYNSDGSWAGYLNSSAAKEVKAESFNKDVTVTKEGFTTWGNFYFSNKKGNTKGALGKVYKAKYTYTLGNGVKYYSLYNFDGSWAGYLNANAAKELKAEAYNKEITIAKEGYTIWSNFYFSSKKGNTTGKLKTKYNAKYVYTLGNGVKYYSLYNTSNVWSGYLNTGAGTNVRSLMNAGQTIETTTSESIPEQDFSDGVEENLDPETTFSSGTENIDLVND